MEQLSFDLLKSAGETPEERIRDTISKEVNKPEYLEFLEVTRNKDETISVKAKSFLAAKIKLTKKIRYVEIHTEHKECFKDFVSMEEISEKNDPEWSRIAVKTIDEVLSLAKPLSIIYTLILSELGGESFGCCSRYLHCSNEKKCINPDFTMSLSCAYKKNLEAGRIFYGVNKTI